MIIVIQCIDQVGLVAAISGVLAVERLNIVSLREHVDKAENRFFLRVQVETPSHPLALQERVQQALAQVLPVDATILVNPMPSKRIVVLVTKEYHCLADILIRHYFQSLNATVLAVIGNYNKLQDICARFEVPFYHITHEGRSKADFEQAIGEIVDGYDPDYLVLAKFMRILSPGFIAGRVGRIINIHHSFLPAFAGANPYRQAFERGVKLIGATAHFVTNDLDEGPIIAQQIIPVSHSLTAADMMQAGKEIETAVLARAMRLVFDDRVFVYNNKTVVFE
ncbi:formyltetrahydrofolate deformylase [Paraflavitalea pollutisoli]|uniref:formyltetrahydrofolate deformylase n=1 Tax=Paraflavitalea pollutisoli TaxID=3034143 RepID=UPI0023ED53E1|nr:formyltetrahydrofolate deformylase [Paraflavitalea sp. H1-2-19X]